VDPDAHTELEATLAARRELGPAHDAELVAGFLERIEKEIDRRVDERIARERRPPARRRSHEAELGIFVPLFIIAGIFGGVAGIGAAAAALVVVFLVSELRR
jgi:hypothetical protein